MRLFLVVVALLLSAQQSHAFIPRISRCILPKTVSSSPVRTTTVASSWRSRSPLQATTTDPTTEVEPEKYTFESNVSRVMDIIINSLYSNKDVFIRELISNAADACDKKRFMSLTDGQTADNLGIRVYADRDAKTLTIEDRGIGMNKEDLIRNLGKIAESGTKRFMESMGKNKDAVSLIGQFGVGFYSGFLVADKMTVITKGSNGEQMRWEAKAESLDQYTIAPDSSEPIETTGTRIILHLKEESDQYMDDVALRALIEKYSEFIPFPIELQRVVTKPEQVPDMDKGMSTLSFADPSIRCRSSFLPLTFLVLCSFLRTVFLLFRSLLLISLTKSDHSTTETHSFLLRT